MPFKSQAQKRYLEANHPEIAKQWAKDTPKVARLPEHVTKPEKKRTKLPAAPKGHW